MTPGIASCTTRSPPCRGPRIVAPFPFFYFLKEFPTNRDKSEGCGIQSTSSSSKLDPFDWTCPAVNKPPLLLTSLAFSSLAWPLRRSPTDVTGCGFASCPTHLSVHDLRHVCFQIMPAFVPLGPTCHGLKALLSSGSN